jgi:hypothetical protein
MRHRVRPQIAITLDEDVLEFIDREAGHLGMTRSRLIENCLMMAVDDLKVLKKLGLLEAVKIIQGFQDRIKKGLLCGCRS